VQAQAVENATWGCHIKIDLKETASEVNWIQLIQDKMVGFY
jgi:hypothetical protein